MPEGGKGPFAIAMRGGSMDRNGRPSRCHLSSVAEPPWCDRVSCSRQEGRACPVATHTRIRGKVLGAHSRCCSPYQLCSDRTTDAPVLRSRVCSWSCSTACSFHSYVSRSSQPLEQVALRDTGTADRTRPLARGRVARSRYNQAFHRRRSLAGYREVCRRRRSRSRDRPLRRQPTARTSCRSCCSGPRDFSEYCILHHEYMMRNRTSLKLH